MPDHSNTGTPLIGTRISVIGISSTGKTTLARHLATLIDGARIELDALYWLPEWQAPTTEDFQATVAAAVDAAPRWVISGNYLSHGIPEITWARGDTLIWLDLPLRTILPRLLRRAWRRWRDYELLQLQWGTATESLGQHLSLLGDVVRHHRRDRRHHAERFADPRWSHLQRHHLRSPSEVARFLDHVEAQLAPQIERGATTDA
jgi:adenylate kinase family enzyme